MGCMAAHCLPLYCTGSELGRNWVLTDSSLGPHWVPQAKKVLSLSLTGDYNAAQNAAVDNAVAAGVVVTVAAGNNNTDAATKSPASAARGMSRCWCLSLIASAAFCEASVPVGARVWVTDSQGCGVCGWGTGSHGLIIVTHTTIVIASGCTACTLLLGSHHCWCNGHRRHPGQLLKLRLHPGPVCTWREHRNTCDDGWLCVLVRHQHGDAIHCWRSGPPARGACLAGPPKGQGAVQVSRCPASPSCSMQGT